MRASDEAKAKYLDCLAAEWGRESSDDFSVELECIERRYRREHERRVTDAQVADLLPKGWRVVHERFGFSKSGIFKKNKRHRTQSTANDTGGQVLAKV